MSKSNLHSSGGDGKSKGVYLDYAASASPNPSSIHDFGVKAKKKLNFAREQVANILLVRSSEIIFTSGGTESNNLAIQGVVLASKGKKLPHIITTNIEHPSVLETCKLLEKRKLAQISIVPVEQNGIIDPKKIKKELKINTVLVSVMYANNEIGTIQPINEIAREIRYYRKTKRSGFPLFHTDGVQAANYLDLNVEKLGVDLLSLSGSKIVGAGRVGVLYKRKSVELTNIFGGGDQEMGLRPGTHNLPEIIKFSSALFSAQEKKVEETQRLKKLREYFIAKLEGMSRTVLGSGLIMNGDIQNSLPNIINVTFQKIPSELLVIELSARGVMASSKSACKSSDAESSYVIRALREKADLPAEEKLSSEGGMRFSLGGDTTMKDIDYTVKSLSEILQKIKKWYK